MRVTGMADSVPTGWFTRMDLEKEWKLSAVQVNRLLRDAMDMGKAKMKKFRIPTTSRGLYPTQHYYFSE